MHWGWAYDGVNSSIPRNTGPECSGYLTMKRQCIECASVLIVCLLALKWGIQNVKPIDMNRLAVKQQKRTTAGKQLLLIIMTFTLGLEMGFKLASRTVIYILNPCHITSIIQIYLLAAKPSKTSTILFRIQMNFLNGPLLAYLFPEIDSRTIPLEAITYYVQHGLMFIIPICLLRHGGVYQMEKLNDFSWNIISYSIILIYHFSFLVTFALLSRVNLNHMLCPAILDPFQGSNFRLLACVHQAILCPILCKLYCILFTPKPSPSSLSVSLSSNAREFNDILIEDNYNLHRNDDDDDYDYDDDLENDIEIEPILNFNNNNNNNNNNVDELLLEINNYSNNNNNNNILKFIPDKVINGKKRNNAMMPPPIDSKKLKKKPIENLSQKIKHNRNNNNNINNNNNNNNTNNDNNNHLLLISEISDNAELNENNFDDQEDEEIREQIQVKNSNNFTNRVFKKINNNRKNTNNNNNNNNINKYNNQININELLDNENIIKKVE